MTKPIEPGCLALVVATPGCDCYECMANRGKLVTVVRALVPGDVIEGKFVPLLVDASCWLVRSVGGDLTLADPPLVWCQPERPFLTRQLKRIDNPDGQDETLRWTPVPTGVPA